MKKNRLHRKIALTLTVALLAGQSHVFVLAEEDAGGALQTEISSGEMNTDAADNGGGGDADSRNAENNGGGNTNNGFEQGGVNTGTDNGDE